MNCPSAINLKSEYKILKILKSGPFSLDFQSGCLARAQQRDVILSAVRKSTRETMVIVSVSVLPWYKREQREKEKRQILIFTLLPSFFLIPR